MQTQIQTHHRKIRTQLNQKTTRRSQQHKLKTKNPPSLLIQEQNQHTAISRSTLKPDPNPNSKPPNKHSNLIQTQLSNPPTSTQT
jgi:hypothetical protein